MPVRIYALAKELTIDSKELVDICMKAGISGKGSALASLSDDEVAKLKSYLSGSPPSGSAPAVTRPAPAKEAAPSQSQEFTREDYIAPGAAASRPKVLDARPSKPDISEDEPALPKKVKKEKDPVIKLAALPEVNEPPPPAAEAPAAQQPVMRLPQDAIRGAREGSSAPLEQFTRQTERKRKVDDKKKTESPDEMPPPATEGRPRRRGKDGSRREAGGTEERGRDKNLAGMASARVSRQDSRRRRGGEDDAPQRRLRRTRKGASTAAPRKGKVAITLPCTVRSFSEATGLASAEIQRTLMGLGNMVTINAALDRETADMLAEQFGLEVEFRQQESVEEKVIARLIAIEDPPEALLLRPPVVTFLGHVDHGKTSLLDAIIGTSVVEGEAGGITQHIRAYEIEKDGREIAFVDTPGHEAFTEMRARGANVTDIAVLVVAADDGVMPQTEEAISHAQAAEVPIVVALNKIDLPGADVNKAMQDLSTHGLLPQEWGGDIEVVQTSAIDGQGLDILLETILLTADLHEYKANPSRAAQGTCLEAQQEGGRGVIAKMIVQNGTLRVGDIVVCGGAHGRVKAMYDTLNPNAKLNEAGPSTPVNLTGLDVAPEAGDAFYVLDDIAQAREIAQARSHRSRELSLGGQRVHISFEEFQRQLEEGVLGESTEPAQLNLILRADVRGSIEAIQKELAKLEHPEVQVRLLQTTVGGISVADVTLADASDAVIIGFNVIPDEAARLLADERGVEIRRYDIIYKVTEDIRALLEGKLEPERRAAELGRALVQQVFTISRVGAVAGCRVLAGTIERGCRIRVNRDGRGIGDYALDSLRRVKDDVKEVREGMECGIKLSGFNDLKEGDVLEAYKIEEVARTL